MMSIFAEALVACFRRLKASQSIGSRRLFDAVNEAFVETAHHGP